MAIQTKDAILKYLKDAIDQETAIVQQEQLIQQADAQHLQIKPSLELKKMRGRKPQLIKWNYYDNKVFMLSLLLGIGLLFIGLIWASSATSHINSAKRDLADTEDRYYEWFKDNYQEDLDEAIQSRTTGVTISILGALCFIPVVISVFSTSARNKREEELYAQKIKEFDSRQTAVYKENKQLEKIYQEQLQEWEASFGNMRAYMHKPLNESRTLLTSFYASDVIYPKYRTLPALTSMYEYFVTGRCTELTGPHGAYNLYEDELRKDTVISQLNTVIENLEQIKQNQYMLYQQVKAIQENTAAISYELQQIKGYTIQIAQLSALNAYYAALNERNTRITMYYHL